MRAKVLFLLLLACLILKSTAQDVSLNDLAASLFYDNPSTISKIEKNEIAELSGFASTSDGTQFYFKDDSYSAEFPFPVAVYPLDLNSDGTEEIAMVFGNMATSGAAGSSCMLFIQNDFGDYERYLGFPGMYSILPTSEIEFPDICIAGPGFEFPVWRWNGTEYEMNRKITDEQLQALNALDVQQASDLYLTQNKD